MNENEQEKNRIHCKPCNKSFQAQLSTIKRHENSPAHKLKYRVSKMSMYIMLFEVRSDQYSTYLLYTAKISLQLQEDSFCSKIFALIILSLINRSNYFFSILERPTFKLHQNHDRFRARFICKQIAILGQHLLIDFKISLHLLFPTIYSTDSRFLG